MLALGASGALTGSVAAIAVGGLTAVLLIASSLMVMTVGFVVAADFQSRPSLRRSRSRTVLIIDEESEVFR